MCGFYLFTKFGDFFIYNINLCGEGILTGCPESMVEIYEIGMRAKNIGQIYVFWFSYKW